MSGSTISADKADNTDDKDIIRVAITSPQLPVVTAARSIQQVPIPSAVNVPIKHVSAIEHQFSQVSVIKREDTIVPTPHIVFERTQPEAKAVPVGDSLGTERQALSISLAKPHDTIEPPLTESLTSTLPLVKRELLDITFAIEKQKEKPGERIRAVKEGNRIILGTENHQSEAQDGIKEVSRPAPIATVEKLGDILEAIDVLTKKIQAESRAGLEDSNTREGVPEFTILVSEELMMFIQQAKNILDTAGEEDSSLESTTFQTERKKQYITIATSEKEIVIDIEILRKLVMLHNRRAQVAGTQELDASMIALEELGLHPLSQNTWVKDMALWSVVLALVHSLILSNDNEQSSDSKKRRTLLDNTIFYLQPSAMSH